MSPGGPLPPGCPGGPGGPCSHMENSSENKSMYLRTHVNQQPKSCLVSISSPWTRRARNTYGTLHEMEHFKNCFVMLDYALSDNVSSAAWAARGTFRTRRALCVEEDSNATEGCQRSRSSHCASSSPGGTGRSTGTWFSLSPNMNQLSVSGLLIPN